MTGLKNELYRLGLHKPGIYYKGEKYLDGICEACGQWAAQLDKNGCCEDWECKKKRIARAFQCNQALKIGNTIIYRQTHAVPLIRMKRGGVKLLKKK